jgi:hypothetical protein
MGWLDANEYLLMETVGRDRIDDLRRTMPLARARVGADDDAPRKSSRPSLGLGGRLVCFLLSPGAQRPLTLPSPPPGARVR